LRRFLQLRQHKTPASAAPGIRGFPFLWNAAVVVDVATVSVVDVVLGGVTVAGEKLHDAPEGNPEQANETAELKPFAGVTETVVVALDPGVAVRDDGEAARVKSGGGRLMVYVALRTGLVI
jgi:hypothetical protein